MQDISESLKEAIRGAFQAPLCKLEVYNKDGSLASEILLDAVNVRVSVASSRKVLRTVQITLDNSEGKYTLDPDLYSQNLLWYTKTIQVYFGYKTGEFFDTEEWVPQGRYTIDSIDGDEEAGTLEIEGQDLMSRLITDKYSDVFKVQGTASESEDYCYFGTGVIQTASSYVTGHGPENVADGNDLKWWSPAPGDLAPWYQIYLGQSRTINNLHASWGDGMWDIYHRFYYKWQYSQDGVSWTDVVELNGHGWDYSTFGSIDHPIEEITCSYLRIVMDPDKLPTTYPIKLRVIYAQMITATQTVDKVIKDILTAAGITQFSIPKTRRYILDRYAPIGEEKERLPRLISWAQGWGDPYFDELGVYTTHPRDINPVEPVWTFDVETDNIFNYSPQYTNKIFNVIIVSYKSSTDKAIFAVAEDNNPNSPTSIQEMGRRVYVYENQEFNDQIKAALFAQQKLYDRTRFKHRTNLPTTGHPALQVDDAVIVNIPQARANNVLYVVTGYDLEFDANGATFDMSLHVSQLDALNDEEETV